MRSRLEPMPTAVIIGIIGLLLVGCSSQNDVQAPDDTSLIPHLGDRLDAIKQRLSPHNVSAAYDTGTEKFYGLRIAGQAVGVHVFPVFLGDGEEVIAGIHVRPYPQDDNHYDIPEDARKAIINALTPHRSVLKHNQLTDAMLKEEWPTNMKPGEEEAFFDDPTVAKAITAIAAVHYGYWMKPPGRWATGSCSHAGFGAVSIDNNGDGSGYTDMYITSEYLWNCQRIDINYN